MSMAPIDSHICKCLVYSWWNCLERIKGCGLVGEVVSLEVGFELSKAQAILT